MKINLQHPKGTLAGVRSLLQLEGHIVEEDESKLSFDIVIKEDEQIPKTIVDSLNYQSIIKSVDYLVSKFYGLYGWVSESLLSLPIFNLLSNGLGPSVVSGIVSSRYESPRSESIFENPLLSEFLKLSGHFGFVTFGMNKLDVVSLHLGIPFFGLYNYLNMTKGSLVERLAGEPTMLPQTWQVSLLLTRFPYPFTQSGKKIFVKIPERVQKHFWPWARAEDFVGESFSTRSNIIGIATSYASKLEHALWYAETTCSYIHVEDKVYFKGGLDELEKRWVEVQEVLKSP